MLLASRLIYSDETGAQGQGGNWAVWSFFAEEMASRGFRNFENHPTNILFFCGKPELFPEARDSKTRN